MSTKNTREGYKLYSEGDAEIREWFRDQWRHWPRRIHNDRTTNLSFHWGGVRAYRDENKFDPDMSSSFSKSVKYLDEHS